MATFRAEIQLTETSTGVSTGEMLGRLAGYLKVAIGERKVPHQSSLTRVGVELSPANENRPQAMIVMSDSPRQNSR